MQTLKKQERTIRDLKQVKVGVGGIYVWRLVSHNGQVLRILGRCFAPRPYGFTKMHVDVHIRRSCRTRVGVEGIGVSRSWTKTAGYFLTCSHVFGCKSM